MKAHLENTPYCLSQLSASSTKKACDGNFLFGRPWEGFLPWQNSSWRTMPFSYFGDISVRTVYLGCCNHLAYGLFKIEMWDWFLNRPWGQTSLYVRRVHLGCNTSVGILLFNIARHPDTTSFPHFTNVYRKVSNNWFTHSVNFIKWL